MRKGIFLLAVLMLLGVFCYSGWMLWSYYSDGAESQAVYDDLAALKVPAATAAPVQTPEEVPDAPTLSQEPEIPEGLVAVTHPTTGETVWMRPEFEALFAVNPEIVGWITVADTKIDYPVVQSSQGNTDYYLTRNFYRKKDAHGCIYAREACDVLLPSDNITLYGHRMNNGSMFGDLGKFKKQSFWESHRTFRFDTLYQTGTYEILAVFQTQAGTEESFRYHLFVDAESPEVFDAYIAACKELALFDIGVEAEYGDQLLTLSTCDYHEDNGRLVVVAKRIGD